MRSVSVAFLIAFICISFLSVRSIFSQDTVDVAPDSEYRPAVDLHWGAGMPKASGRMFPELNSAPSFSSVGAIDLRLGFASCNAYAKYAKEALIKYEQNFLFLSHYSGNIGGSVRPSGLNASFWSFGIGSLQGLGYKAGKDLNIIFNSGGGLKWTRAEIDGYDKINDEAVTGRLDPYQETFRFGDYWEGQIKIGSRFVSLNLSYGQMIIMPAHVFFPWLGSKMIQEAASAALNSFLFRIADLSLAGPIVYFVLANALHYGFYALKKNDMNWPFGYDSPLTTDEFKVGLGFSF